MEKLNIDIISCAAEVSEICGVEPEDLIEFVNSLLDKYELKASDFEEGRG